MSSTNHEAPHDAVFSILSLPPLRFNFFFQRSILNNLNLFFFFVSSKLHTHIKEIHIAYFNFHRLSEQTDTVLDPARDKTARVESSTITTRNVWDGWIIQINTLSWTSLLCKLPVALQHNAACQWPVTTTECYRHATPSFTKAPLLGPMVPTVFPHPFSVHLAFLPFYMASPFLTPRLFQPTPTNPRPELTEDRRCSQVLWLLLLWVKVGWGTWKDNGKWIIWLCSRATPWITDTPLVPHSKHSPSKLYKPVS